MKLTFWGAAQQVTGSMYLLELDDDYRILIDCGFDMEKNHRTSPEGDNDGLYQKGRIFPFEPSMINVVLLTHAHIDHSGNLPNLVREGFEGQIVCTAATYALSQLLLSDSAELHQQRWKKYDALKKKKSSQSLPNPSEWYVKKHVQDTESHFFSLQFNRRFLLTQGVWITFIPTGHLLGAANILIEVQEGGEIKKILFSGDIGRYNYPLLPDPQSPPQADYVICETTYGNRVHQTKGNPEEELFEIIHKACVEIPGRLIIPAFSVGRTQALLYTLNKLCVDERLPPIKVFADSPLAYKSTQTYNSFINLLNEEAKEFYKENQTLFDFDNLIYVEDLKTSKQVSNHAEPCIIISSSGMIQGGRVEHHVKTNIQNPYATILMIGYAAEGTMGYDLMHGSKTLEIGTKRLAVMATVKYIDIFSGHADQKDLLRFIKHQDTQTLKKVFLVHGEATSMKDFQQLLLQHGYNDVEAPLKGQCYEL